MNTVGPSQLNGSRVWWNGWDTGISVNCQTFASLMSLALREAPQSGGLDGSRAGNQRLD